MEARAFLFDADSPGLGNSYGDPINRAFYGAVLEADVHAQAKFKVGSGDLLVHSLTYRPTRFEKGEKPFHGGLTRANDPKLRFTLIWDLCDSSSQGWHTFDPNQLALIIARHNIAAICASQLSDTMSKLIVRRLSKEDFFLGGFQIDAGNPLHRHLFFNYLIFDEVYSTGSLFFIPDVMVPKDELYDLDQTGFWWSDLQFRSVEWIDDDAHDLIPALPTAPISERGKESLRLLQGRAVPTHVERVALALEDATREASELVAWEVPQLSRPNEAALPRGKFVDYLLNPEHDSGQHKARLFKDLLDIGRDDWRFLEYQIRRLLPASPVIHRVRYGEHGVQYHVDIPIRGRNGRVMPVRTGWIIRDPESPPQLVTALIAPRGVDVTSLPPSLVPPLLTDTSAGPRSWTQLLDLAHAEARKAAEQ